MSRKILLAYTFLVMAVSLSEAGETSQLTANQIVDKNVTARGGLQAWREVQTLSMTGKMDARGNNRPTIPVPGTKTGPGMPAPRSSEQVQLPFVMELKRTRKTRLEILFHGQTAIQVYDGTNGWKLRPFLNRHEVEPFTPEEKKAASLQSDLDGPLVDYAAKGTKVELEGLEEVEGKDTYKLKLMMKDGQVQQVWVDSQTFLETKIEGAPRRLDGKYHPTAIYYRNYRPVNGLMVPHVLETTVEGIRQMEKIEIEKVAVDPKLDDSRFAKLQ
jgi:outer membrane lipoprotein-sorting protein